MGLGIKPYIRTKTERMGFMTNLTLKIIEEVILGALVYLTLFKTEKLQFFWKRFEKWNPSILKQRLIIDKLIGVVLLLFLILDFITILRLIFEK